MGNQTALNIHFDPLLPDSWLLAAGSAGLVLLVLALWRCRKGLGFRLVTFSFFILALLNPSLLEEQREPVSDVAVIVVDQSPSQSMGNRTERTGQALSYLQDELAKRDGLEVRVLKTPEKDILANETLLFTALEKTLADIPPQRRAGVIFLSDGQIHDVPVSVDAFEQLGPVHTLLSGDRQEKDRQLVMLQTPSYGIVGQNVTLKYKIEDTDNINRSDATITIKRPDSPLETLVVPVGEELFMDLTVGHAGQNVYEINVQSIAGEITESNNRAALIVNGVRDRLKVLLVSGKPHAGGRTWRDLLTADPGVDLIHFTILREPDKLDATPQNELALIAFPFRELFEVKLYEFDLIIFDRYRLNRILPENYFNNIVRYVEEGGALLEASGPSFAGDNSIYYTSLMKILPGIPSGEIIREPFRPGITKDGQKHPVTKNLLWTTADDGQPAWGNWLRQVAVSRESGDILMAGADENPLLILDRVKEGRVAQIASDHIWLWSRGYEGGGPHTELLRRVVHWLMKEPELDEKALEIAVSGQRIILRTQNYKQDSSAVIMTRPDGETELVELEETPSGDIFSKTIQAGQLGIYSFEDPLGQKRYAAIGDLNPPELRGVKTTEKHMTPVASSSGGGILWLSETPAPDIRTSSGRNNFAGRSWIALRQNNDYTVTGIENRPVLPPELAAFILLAMALATWWREGRSD